MILLGLAIILLLAGCTDIGGYYAKSLGIESLSQLRKARADYQAALAGFVNASVLTEEERGLKSSDHEMKQSRLGALETVV